ncbi:MAG: tyrosine-type recombinase/integrase [Bacillota bacterium]
MPGHLEQRSSKSWTIIIEAGRDPKTGKRKRIKKAFRGTKKAAEKEMARMLYELEQGLFVEVSKLSFGDYLTMWLNEYARNKAPKTYLRYEEIILKSVIPELGQIRIEKLKPLHLQSYYTKMLESGKKNGTGLSPTTVLQHHRIIHKALEMAIKWQIVPRNIADAVDPPKKFKSEITPLNEDQVRMMIKSATSTVYYTQIVLAVLTGMRRGEIYGLRWQDIDSKNGTITIKQTAQYTPKDGIIYKEPKTSRSKRTIDVSDFVLDALKRQKVEQIKARLAMGKKYRNKENLVFTLADGKPQHPDSISTWFPEFMNKSKLPRIRYHDLRHTHASLLLKGGESLKLICDRLGHSSIGITADTYTHLAPGMQKKAAANLEEKIFQTESGTKRAPKTKKRPRAKPRKR